jgi:hypothetical protein
MPTVLSPTKRIRTVSTSQVENGALSPTMNDPSADRGEIITN